MLFAAHAGSTIPEFILLIVSFFRRILVKLANTYFYDFDRHTISLLAVLVVAIVFSAFISVFYKGARG